MEGWKGFMRKVLGLSSKGNREPSKDCEQESYIKQIPWAVVQKIERREFGLNIGRWEILSK